MRGWKVEPGSRSHGRGGALHLEDPLSRFLEVYFRLRGKGGLGLQRWQGFFLPMFTLESNQLPASLTYCNEGLCGLPSWPLQLQGLWHKFDFTRARVL